MQEGLARRLPRRFESGLCLRGGLARRLLTPMRLTPVHPRLELLPENATVWAAAHSIDKKPGKLQNYRSVC
jgi:hypothetical protein